jgi:hypothetical protein
MAKTGGAAGDCPSWNLCGLCGTMTVAQRAVSEGGTGLAWVSGAGSGDTGEDAATWDRKARGEVSTILPGCTASRDDECVDRSGDSVEGEEEEAGWKGMNGDVEGRGGREDSVEGRAGGLFGSAAVTASDWLSTADGLIRPVRRGLTFLRCV